MTAVLLGDYEPNSPDWHALRAQGLGASEIAATVGLSPFESAFSLWHRKKGTLPGPDPSNPLFLWGHLLEPVVADRFAVLHPEYETQLIGTHRHHERAWQLASLDRLLVYKEGATVPLEIKTTRYGDNWGPTGTDQIPLHVRCQVMQQMDVFSAPYAWVAVLIGGNDYREYCIPYDADDAATLRTAGAAFWASVQNNDEPPLDASRETYEAVRDIHPEIDGTDVEIEPRLWVDYAQTKDVKAQADDAHRLAKANLLHAMGQARRALVHETPVLRRQPARNGTVSLYPIKESA